MKAAFKQIIKKKESKIQKISAKDIPNITEYYRFGREYFGPFLYGFDRWLLNHFHEAQYDKVFFFSRDGYMMKNGFDILDNNHIDNEYVYFSRKSIRQTFLWRKESYEDSLEYLAWERFYTIGKILEYYGFDEDERIAIANERNIDLHQDVAYATLKHNSLIQKLYDDLVETIKEKSRQQDEILYRYIEQIGMVGKCAMIDIGWHGSMQYYLEQYFLSHNINTTLDGYYVGILPNVPLRGKTYGYVYNETDPEKRKQVLCFFGGYEKLFQSIEGSTYGYIYEGDKVVPTIASYEYDLDKDREIITAIKEWQAGALDFIRAESEVKSEKTDDELTSPLIKFGMNPPNKGVDLFSFFYSNDGGKEYYTAQKSLFRYSPKEFIHAFSNSQWKTGFMKSAFKAPLPYFLIYKMLRK